MKKTLLLIVLILVLSFGSQTIAGTAHQSQDNKSASHSGTMKSGVRGDTFTHHAVVEGVRAEFQVMSLASMNMKDCLLYTSPSPRDGLLSRMPSSA